MHALTSPGWQAVTGSNLKSPDDGGSRGPGEVTRPVTAASRTGDQRDVTRGRLRVVGVLHVETEARVHVAISLFFSPDYICTHTVLVSFWECGCLLDFHAFIAELLKVPSSSETQKPPVRKAEKINLV